MELSEDELEIICYWATVADNEGFHVPGDDDPFLKIQSHLTVISLNEPRPSVDEVI